MKAKIALLYPVLTLQFIDLESFSTMDNMDYEEYDLEDDDGRMNIEESYYDNDEIDMTGRQLDPLNPVRMVYSLDLLNLLAIPSIGNYSSLQIESAIQNRIIPILNLLGNSDIHVVLKMVTLSDGIEFGKVVAIALGSFKDRYNQELNPGSNMKITIWACQNGPDKARDDRLVLIIASHLNGIPISNDQYRGSNDCTMQPVIAQHADLDDVLKAYDDSDHMKCDHYIGEIQYRIGLECTNAPFQPCVGISQFGMVMAMNRRVSPTPNGLTA